MQKEEEELGTRRGDTLTDVVVVCGNDGTGKTSTAAALNLHFATHCPSWYAFQRSTTPPDPLLKSLKDLISPKQLDNTTFIYPFEQRPDLPRSLDWQSRTLTVRWVMLDAELETIEMRIKTRQELTIFEVRKCLEYYKKVYREMSFFYGIPLIPTDNANLLSVCETILHSLHSNHPGTRQFKMQGLRPEMLDKCETFSILRQSNRRRVYKINNPLFSNFQLIVNEEINTKDWMILLELLHMNNIDHPYICLNIHGVIVARVQSTTDVRVKVTAWTDQNSGKERVNLQYYDTGVEEGPLDGDGLGEGVEVGRLERMGLRVYSVLSWYCEKVGHTLKNLICEQSGEVVCGSVTFANVSGNWEVYNKLEESLLCHRFHLTQLPNYNTYPYEEKSLQLYLQNSPYKYLFKQLYYQNKQKPDLLVLYQTGEPQTTSCRLLQNRIDEPKGGGFERRMRFNGVNKAVISQEEYQQRRQQVGTQKQNIVVEVEVRLEESGSIIGAHVLPAIQALKLLAQDGIQMAQLRFVDRKRSLIADVSYIREALRLILIETPRRLQRIVVRNEASTIEELRDFWSFKRVVPTVPLELDEAAVLKEMCFFDARGECQGVVTGEDGRYKHSLRLTEAQFQKACRNRLLTQQQLLKVSFNINGHGATFMVGNQHNPNPQHLFPPTEYPPSADLSSNTQSSIASLPTLEPHPSIPTTLVIALGNGKYFATPQKFLEQQIGVKIYKSGSSKSLSICHLIIDDSKYSKYFQTHQVSFILTKSTDMGQLMHDGVIDGCITFSPIVENSPYPAIALREIEFPSLMIALIKRSGDVINPLEWSPTNKALIACEHIVYVKEYLKSQGIQDDSYVLTPVGGSSESFLVGLTKVRYLLCDAIVESGRTLKENNLEVWRSIRENIQIGLYIPAPAPPSVHCPPAPLPPSFHCPTL